MDKWQAQDAFWNGFGVPAFDELTALDAEDPVYPRLTYQAMNGKMGQQMTISASLWYREKTWKNVSQKADEIQAAITNGAIVKVDGGYFWFKMPAETPFAQRIAPNEDNEVKRILLTLEAEALTN